MKSLGAIAVLTVLGLGGCVSWRSTDLTPSGSSSALTRSVKGFGLFLNIHTGFEWLSGDACEKTTIQLHGTKDHYTETEFDIVDWDGKPIPYLQAKTGTVTLDQMAHTVVIAIYIDGKPFSLNGRHSYRDKSPNPALNRTAASEPESDSDGTGRRCRLVWRSAIQITNRE